MTESVRLAKRLAADLSCSRGDAERYIEGGWVAVDGKTVEEPGARVAPGQTVALLPGAKLEDIKPVTVLVHKPAGTYADNEPGSALDLIIPKNLMPGDRSGRRYLKRMFNGLKLVTPLERAASGLVVYTQEYAVSRKLMEEGKLVEQEYVAQVTGKLSDSDLARLQRGMAFEGRAATPMKVSWQNETHLRFALKTPPLGFIEYVCDTAGLQLQQLRRIRIGRLPLAGMAAGQWRYRLDYERF
ncbi:MULTISPECIES: RNA pseudouridine synthase [Achromobacter]|jgi:23S rRNA pseudouridine2604 synthase|uniref:Dual-specificity RNA pseudouridine synthase RluF n=1 Tax=Achromobacter spanius TaxID=217203 RepID=A0A2S5GK52_9BURK|nr:MULTISPECIES: RNA pseudouridine synthase [Achromobacter]MDX3983668.1 RNA pseudouridine synthase [Achromobacter sp.]PPA73261.1 RNA-binding protein [Achromobacter spanius]QYJ24280.1 RNA-binding protein [Achromobacter sp. ES-001]HCQ46030.1 RNA-binding protein [Achromobacter sp.]